MFFDNPNFDGKKKGARRKFLREMGADPASPDWAAWSREEAKLDLISYSFGLEDEFLFATLKMAATMHEWQAIETGFDGRPDAPSPFH